MLCFTRASKIAIPFTTESSGFAVGATTWLPIQQSHADPTHYPKQTHAEWSTYAVLQWIAVVPRQQPLLLPFMFKEQWFTHSLLSYNHVRTHRNTQTQYNDRGFALFYQCHWSNDEGGIASTLCDTVAICQSCCWNTFKSHELSHLNMADALCIIAVPCQLNNVQHFCQTTV